MNLLLYLQRINAMLLDKKPNPVFSLPIFLHQIIYNIYETKDKVFSFMIHYLLHQSCSWYTLSICDKNFHLSNGYLYLGCGIHFCPLILFAYSSDNFEILKTFRLQNQTFFFREFSTFPHYLALKRLNLTQKPSLLIINDVKRWHYDRRESKMA